MSRERSVTRSRTNPVEGGRSYLFPVILLGILAAGAYGVDLALKRQGIDAGETFSSVTPVCDGIPENDMVARRDAVARAYSRYVVQSSGNISRGFENFDRATIGCNTGSFSFRAGEEPRAETPPIEPADAP